MNLTIGYLDAVLLINNKGILSKEISLNPTSLAVDKNFLYVVPLTPIPPFTTAQSPSDSFRGLYQFKSSPHFATVSW